MQAGQVAGGQEGRGRERHPTLSSVKEDQDDSQDDTLGIRMTEEEEERGSKGGAWNSISTLPLSSPSMRIRMTRGIRTSVEIRMTEDQGWNQGHQECFPSLSPLLFTSERLCWWLSAVGKEKDEGVMWLVGSIWNRETSKIDAPVPTPV